jgi:ubiquinone/menaquinone biosynthesis C-methylase UbiE
MTRQIFERKFTMSTNQASLASSTRSQEDPATALTRARYQRISAMYDRMEGMMERRIRPWRAKLWQFANGPRLLEVGVGTGKNIEFWPKDCKVTAIDLTPGMLELAQQRTLALKREGDDLFLADIQHLELPSEIFDTVVATCVFCSVPDPVKGLREIGRVVRPDGHVLLLEHIRIDKPVIGSLMDILTPLVVGINGANINRRTIENVRAAGLRIDHVIDLDKMGMFKIILARPGAV